MAYIGAEPIVSATRTITEVTATAGQTVFTANGGYTVGYIDVFLNGAQLQTSDFTATNGTTITLTEAAQVGDVIRLVAWGTFLTSTALNSTNPSYTGTLTGGTGVVNIGSGQLFKDASGNLGVGTSSPNGKLDVAGTINVSSSDGNTGGIITTSGEASLSNKLVIHGSRGAGGIIFQTNSSERMRITASGGVAFGGASNFGSSGQLLQSNGDAAPTWVTAAALGVGQSWTNVGGSRSSGTTYTNSTGRPIQLMVATDNSGNTTYGSGGSAKFFINGNNVGESFCSNAANIGGLFQAVIPNGATYQVSASTIRSWWELR